MMARSGTHYRPCARRRSGAGNAVMTIGDHFTRGLAGEGVRSQMQYLALNQGRQWEVGNGAVMCRMAFSRRGLRGTDICASAAAAAEGDARRGGR